MRVWAAEAKVYRNIPFYRRYVFLLIPSTLQDDGHGIVCNSFPMNPNDFTLADHPKKSLMQRFGPGLITGASDDDPSAIGTYSQLGAQFGWAMLWTMPFSLPLMAAAQEISARIGRVTGKGLASNLRRHYPAWQVNGLLGLLLIAILINVGADLGAMGAAVHLLLGGPELAYVLIFGLVSVYLQVFVSYTRYVSWLKGLTVVLLVYVAVSFTVSIPWGSVLYNTFLPSFSWHNDYITGIMAAFGATLNAYLFFWQASSEVEQQAEAPGEAPLKNAPQQARVQFHAVRMDTWIGMAFSNLIGFFIILTAAATLHIQGLTHIETATQAASALKPIVGPAAFWVFSIGIIGTGLLAIPVMAGAAAYSVGEVLRWPVGLARQPGEAKGFYGIIAVATGIGVLFNFIGIDAMKALYWSAVINDAVDVPVLYMMMRLATNPQVMGDFTLPFSLRTLGWLATAIMTFSSLALAITSLN